MNAASGMEKEGPQALTTMSGAEDCARGSIRTHVKWVAWVLTASRAPFVPERPKWLMTELMIAQRGSTSSESIAGAAGTLIHRPS